MRPAVGLLLFYKEKSEENENMKNYKIAVAGTGYVGLSLSVLLPRMSNIVANGDKKRVDDYIRISAKLVTLFSKSKTVERICRVHPEERWKNNISHI